MLRQAMLAAAMMAFATPALANGPVCTDRSTVLGHLATEYSEAPVGMGIANNGGVVEILSSESGNSWTIILTMPNGVSCMIAAGENWEELPEHVVELGPPA